METKCVKCVFIYRVRWKAKKNTLFLNVHCSYSIYNTCIYIERHAISFAKNSAENNSGEKKVGHESIFIYQSFIYKPIKNIAYTFDLYFPRLWLCLFKFSLFVFWVKLYRDTNPYMLYWFFVFFFDSFEYKSTNSLEWKLVSPKLVAVQCDMLFIRLEMNVHFFV